MHRFHLPPEQCNQERIVLSGREAHRGLHVLRLRKGEEIAILDGAGKEFRGVADELSRDTITARLTRVIDHKPLPAAITLVQAIPKGKIFESIVQKATELGAACVIPLVSERVISQFDIESGAQKSEKWQQVAIEAIKQSGNPWLPKIEAPISPADLLKRAGKTELFLIGSLREDSRHPRQYIDEFIRTHSHPPRAISVWVGPEGDFTPAEYDAAQAAGALPITLGRTVLRSETAATYCLSVIGYEMQYYSSRR